MGDKHTLRSKCRPTGTLLSQLISGQEGMKNQGFRGKKRKPTGSKKFVCLAGPSMKYAPTMAEKQILSEAGLGEKNLSIKDSNLSPSQLKDIVLELFPKLEEAGGYELLYCSGNNRVLLPINGPYTPRNIKERTGQGRIYIRPIQNELNIDSQL
ncbi:uncharacterized protein LOC117121324 [Anneissia japonica]|uniref:uncharacterized protein LOC117121324 n=1 Tax=Anneissia japonica TaxID=1529436 RepID=UPI001425B66B|nr:uncharacterized protein LOC117121324 [Anneissia japonica]